MHARMRVWAKDSKNLIDAANIVALAALSTFWRPECTVGGDDGQQVTVHDPEIDVHSQCALLSSKVRDLLPLTIHHMPIVVTFAYFGEGNIVVLDPTYKEEAVMGGRMTAIVNSNGDVCAIQKAGGEGPVSSVTMQCLRIASVKAAVITSKIKKAKFKFAFLIFDILFSGNNIKIMNLGGDGQGASGVITDVLRNTDDDAVDPHLERIKNQAGDEESDEE
ncbi:hypothetical protein ACJX0J_028347, partial [Zea mays]